MALYPSLLIPPISNVVAELVLSFVGDGLRDDSDLQEMV